MTGFISVKLNNHKPCQALLCCQNSPWLFIFTWALTMPCPLPVLCSQPHSRSPSRQTQNPNPEVKRKEELFHRQSRSAGSSTRRNSLHGEGGQALRGCQAGLQPRPCRSPRNSAQGTAQVALSVWLGDRVGTRHSPHSVIPEVFSSPGDSVDSV